MLRAPAALTAGSLALTAALGEIDAAILMIPLRQASRWFVWLALNGGVEGTIAACLLALAGIVIVPCAVAYVCYVAFCRTLGDDGGTPTSDVPAYSTLSASEPLAVSDEIVDRADLQQQPAHTGST